MKRDVYVVCLSVATGIALAVVGHLLGFSPGEIALGGVSFLIADKCVRR